ncbi:MAG: helix-turn-helix domain-containing protein [Ardenticatenaceae bacterium]|nr:helix-turn-helix domain-containing protein [Ardenticatenaceae bacterium]
MQREDLMTVEEVADLLRMHLDSVRRLLRQGRSPGVRLGKHWWIRQADLEALLRSAGHETERSQV